MHFAVLLSVSLGVCAVFVTNNVCFGHESKGKIRALREGESELTNTWAVELDTEDEEIAKDIAKRYGYVYGGKIGSLPRHFMFVRKDEAKKSLINGQENDESESSRHDYKRVLEKHPRVKWAERQAVLQREKQISKH